MNKLNISFGVAILALVLAFGGLLVGKNQPVDIDKIAQRAVEIWKSTLGGITRLPNANPLEVESLGFEAETGTQRTVVDVATIQIPVASTTITWQNTTGREVQAWAQEGIPSGQNASSSYMAYLFSSTTPYVDAAYDIQRAITQTFSPMLVFSHTVATGTGSGVATTSESAYRNFEAPTSGAILTIPNNGYAVLYMKKDTGLSNQTCVTLGRCATATSTDRGINPYARIFYVSTTTPFVGR